MGSRLQQERKGGTPPISTECKSLGQYESEWLIPPSSPRHQKPREHKWRGGEANHGKHVHPGDNLSARGHTGNEIPIEPRVDREPEQHSKKIGG